MNFGKILLFGVLVTIAAGVFSPSLLDEFAAGRSDAKLYKGEEYSGADFNLSPHQQEFYKYCRFEAIRLRFKYFDKPSDWSCGCMAAGLNFQQADKILRVYASVLTHKTISERDFKVTNGSGFHDRIDVYASQEKLPVTTAKKIYNGLKTSQVACIKQAYYKPKITTSIPATTKSKPEVTIKSGATTTTITRTRSKNGSSREVTIQGAGTTVTHTKDGLLIEVNK